MKVSGDRIINLQIVCTVSCWKQIQWFLGVCTWQLVGKELCDLGCSILYRVSKRVRTNLILFDSGEFINEPIHSYVCIADVLCVYTNCFLLYCFIIQMRLEQWFSKIKIMFRFQLKVLSFYSSHILSEIRRVSFWTDGLPTSSCLKLIPTDVSPDNNKTK